MIQELIKQTRSTRRFEEDRPVSTETLRGLVELARCTGSHRNAQALRFRLINDRDLAEQMFPYLTFARALGPEGRPQPGQRPAAYIALIGDGSDERFLWCDAGLACQSMLLGAVEQGLAGCILGGLQREPLMKLLDLDPQQRSLMLILALGYPAEKACLEPVPNSGSLTYWQAEDGLHIPKLSLDQLII